MVDFDKSDKMIIKMDNHTFKKNPLLAFNLSTFPLIFMISLSLSIYIYI